MRTASVGPVMSAAPRRSSALRLSRLSLVLLCAMVFSLLPYRGNLAVAWAATMTVTTTNDSGPGSLRQAIVDANASPGLDVITFAIGSGGQTIAPTSQLPTIADPVVIDGTTQPGYAGIPLIELNGANISEGGTGLNIATSDSTVRGLIINRFTQYGVYIGGPAAINNTVAGNYIGTDATGTLDLGNGIDGVVLTAGASYNTIGGTTAADRNVISGNGLAGIAIGRTGPCAGAAGPNTISGNYIGTNAAGTAAIPNNAEGVVINDCSAGNIIGGTLTEAGNLISGNTFAGVAIVNAANNVVQSNLIGTNAAGSGALANSGGGVSIGSTGQPTTDNLIGGNTEGGNAGNVIAFNTGSGVVLGNSNAIDGTLIQGNAIFANTGLGIDLGADGVTANDTYDYDDGPNGLQNVPLLTEIMFDVETGDTTISGQLSSGGSSTFQIEFFASPDCDPSGYGEGKLALGTTAVTTDEGGNASFEYTFEGNLGDNQFTATATDSANNTSEFAACQVATDPNIIDRDNRFWTTAYELTLSGSDPMSLAASVQQHLIEPDQSAWFKVNVPADSRLIVQLADLPANYDLALYSDIDAAYQKLTTPQDPNLLSTQFAPLQFSPLQFSPLQFSPLQFSPLQFSPLQFSPLQFSPLQFSPLQFSPLQFSPLEYAPLQFSPLQFSGDSKAFASAQDASLMAVSASPGTADELIIRNTWNTAANFYIRVLGREGSYSLAAPFTLDVMALGSVCSNVAPITSGSTLTASNGNYTTIILADFNRLQGQYGNPAALQAKLNTFKDRSEVRGIVVDVNSDSRVRAANAQADANPECTYAKNLVAYEIKRIIDGYISAGNPLEYVVLIGNDEQIPFFREPDRAELANEQQYVVPVLDGTPSQASIKRGYVLSQDRYGASFAIDRDGVSLPLPGLAVGRLVETPAEMIGMLDAYLSTNGGVVATPRSALVTGYDFLAQGATAIQSQLQTGLGTSVESMISPQALSPTTQACAPNATSFATCVWTADNLRTRLLGQRYDLMFVAGHFSAGSALAADQRTTLDASEIVASSVDLTNAIIFSPGCHSGYNVVDAHDIPGVTTEPDWAQALARKRATLIAGTGYQYGDTDFVEYSERLYVEFSKQLRHGSGPVALGKALVEAKQAYLAGTPTLNGVHDKTILIATLFGLPMLRVDLPAGRDTSQPDGPAISGLNGGFSADLTLTPSLTQNTLTLRDATDLNQTRTATYLAGQNGVVTNPSEPVLPLELRNVSVANKALRGVGFRGGSYTDLQNIFPLTGAPATEISNVRIPFRSTNFYPIQAWGANYVAALGGGPTRMVVTPAQYKSNTPDSLTGTLRKHTSMKFRLFYSPAANAVAVPAPVLSDVSAESSNGQLSFRVRAEGLTDTDIKEAWITYTATQGSWYGSWQSLNLTRNSQDPTLWEGTLALNGTSAADVRYMVQAVNATGLVALTTNLGAYFTPDVPALYADVPAAPNQQATTLTFTQSPASVAYDTTATWKVKLDSSGGPLANQPITFVIGSQQRLATTNSSGVASVSVRVLDSPATDVVANAQFAGKAEYRSSVATSSFSISKRSTKLSLASAPPQTSGDIQNVTATLSAKNGGPLAFRTVVFELRSGNTVVQRVPAVTDFQGKAALGSVAVNPGSYSVRATFAGDNLYAAKTSGSLTVKAAKAQYLYSWIVLAGTRFDLAAYIAGGPISGAQVRFDVRNRVGVRVATVYATSHTHGVYKTTLNGLPVGVYTVETSVVGPNIIATTPGLSLLAVFNIYAGAVTGNGWINSPAGACRLTTQCQNVAGKATFELSAKYANGNTTPKGTSQFKLEAANLTFSSTAYDWLVVVGPLAQYWGSGTINGTGNYGFMLTAFDGGWHGGNRADRFRMKIWNKANGKVVYDNLMYGADVADPPTALGGGNIEVSDR